MKTRVLFALTGLLTLGCLAPAPGSESGGVAGVGLYAFDQSSKSLMVWKDLSATFDGDKTLTPSLTLTSSEFSNLTSLGWSGMAFDGSRNQLYLVNDNGNVVRINRARSQTGAISSADAISFSMNNTSPLTNSKFGQAAVDTSSNTLYLTENGDNGTRIWAVANASTLAAHTSVSLVAVQVSTSGGGGADSGGYGVAAASNVVYGSFTGGATITIGGTSYSGPRLRKGTTTGFPPDTQVLIGSNTQVGTYAPLALDTSNNILYTGVQTASASPMLAFKISQFTSGPNQSPNAVFGDSGTLSTVRFLSHAGTKDWLVAGDESGTTLWIWKQPATSTTNVLSKAVPGTAVFRAIALDSNG